MTQLLSRDQIRTVLNNQKLNCLVRRDMDPTTCLKHSNDVLMCQALAIAEAQKDLDDEEVDTSYSDAQICRDCREQITEQRVLCEDCHDKEIRLLDETIGEQRFI